MIATRLQHTNLRSFMDDEDPVHDDGLAILGICWVDVALRKRYRARNGEKGGLESLRISRRRTKSNLSLAIKRLASTSCQVKAVPVWLKILLTCIWRSLTESISHSEACFMSVEEVVRSADGFIGLACSRELIKTRQVFHA